MPRRNPLNDCKRLAREERLRAVMLPIADQPDALLELREGRAFAIAIADASDGAYALAGAGGLVVRGGNLTGAGGDPHAPAGANPEG